MKENNILQNENFENSPEIIEIYSENKTSNELAFIAGSLTTLAILGSVKLIKGFMAKYKDKKNDNNVIIEETVVESENNDE